MGDEVYAKAVSDYSLENFENELNGNLIRIQENGYNIKDVKYSMSVSKGGSPLYSAIILYY